MTPPHSLLGGDTTAGLGTAPLIVEVVGPRLTDHGGVATVNQNFASAGLFAEAQEGLAVRFFPSTRDGSPIVRLGYALLSLTRFAARFRDFPDIVHVHASWRGSCVRKTLYAQVAIRRGRKVVFQIHPSDFYEFIDRQSVWFRKAVESTLRRSSAIIVLTPEMRDITSSKAPGVPIFILSNPVDTKVFYARENIPRDSDHVLFFGRFDSRKGVFDLLRAVRRLRVRGLRIRLTLAGGKETASVRSVLTQLSLTDTTDLKDWLRPTEVAELLRRGTLLALPTYSEGLPMVLLEAMMCGTPIVTCPVGGVQRIVQHGRNGLLVPPGDVAALAAAIEKLVSSRELQLAMATNNIMDSAHFRTDVVIRELRLIYQSVYRSLK